MGTEGLGCSALCGYCGRCVPSWARHERDGDEPARELPALCGHCGLVTEGFNRVTVVDVGVFCGESCKNKSPKYQEALRHRRTHAKVS